MNQLQVVGWTTTVLIALLNMAFLFIAALWLTGNTYRVADAAQPVPAAAGNSEGTALADLQASVAATNTRLQITMGIYLV